MKKIYTLASAFVVSFGLTAQIQQTNLEVQSESLIQKTTPTFENNTTNQKAPAPEAITTIWSDDFSTTTNWNYAGGANEWDIVTQLSSSLTGQGFDAAINSTSGGNFAFIDSDAQGAAGSQDAFVTYTNTIDCSTYPDIRLTFETYFRQYVETREVQISVDGGANWTIYPVLTQFGTNTSSPNAYTETVNISAVAGGQANVMVRFHYVGAYDWFCCVDDVMIVTAPENDLSLDQEYYNGYADSTNTLYYQKVPQRHAALDTLSFGGAYKNLGVNDQPNAMVTVDVQFGGSSVYNNSSAAMNSVSGVSDSSDITTPFMPTSTLGVYDVSFYVSSDSVDQNTTNDTISDSFEVTANEYARDNGIVTSGNWYTVTSDWEMLNLFRIAAADTAVAISVRFPVFSSGRGLAEGDALSYYLYADADLENPIAKNEFHIVTAAEVDTWITLPLPTVTLAPGFYYAGFKIYNDNSAVGSSGVINDQTPPFSVLVRTDAADPSDQWSYTTSLTPFIHLYTSDPDACNGVTIAIADTVYDNQEIGAVTIGVTGGTPTYTYSWTGPNGYVSNVQNPNDIPHQGTYNVVVTDVFGCTGTKDVSVEGIVTVDELGFDNTLSLFPNPNNGTFRLIANNVASGEYTVVVRNVIGQNVFVQTISANGTISQDIQLDKLNNGVYFLELSNEAGNKEVIKFIVE